MNELNKSKGSKKSGKPGEIEKLRREINEIDGELIRLIAERMKIAEKIGAEKSKQNIALVDLSREREVLRAVGEKASDLGLEGENIMKIFSDLMNMSKNRQIKILMECRQPNAISDSKKAATLENMRIAFQGEGGAYSELAIKNNFPKAEARPYPQFEDVFDSLEDGSAECALVPVENSTEGSVNSVYDLLLQRNIGAVAEVFLRIEHMLIAQDSSGKIETVYSHPQALAQCREHIIKNKLKAEPFYDTAGAVKMLKEQKPIGAAAIASKAAAELYGMKIIASSIEDNKNNYTRFLLIACKDNAEKCRSKINAITRINDVPGEVYGRVEGGREKGGKYKTSMIFGLPNVPGALYSVLKDISEEKINVTKIESRPTKRTPWEYIFYIDFEGNVADAKVNMLLEKIKAKMAFMKVIGSYVNISIENDSVMPVNTTTGGNGV